MASRTQRPAAQQPKARYRVVCYELIDDQQNIIMDAADDGFITATGSIHNAVPGRRTRARRPPRAPSPFQRS